MIQNTINAVKISKEHHEELSTELRHRTHTMRPEIGERVKDARALGDLSENAEYHSSRDEQRKNEARIEELEVMLKYAIIVKKVSSETVQLTSVVKLDKSGTEMVYTVVSSIESDIKSGKISVDSPIGKLLLGKRVGETFAHSTPGGNVQYTVLGIQ